MKQYNVLLFRGLWGTIWSAGLDILALELKKLPNVDYVLVLPYTSANRAANMVSQFKDETILIGHSFGVGAFLNVAKANPTKEFPLAISFDPSQYWRGGHTLSKNIKRCINFWQDAIWWRIGNQKIKGAENIHVDTTHTDIEDRRDLHLKVLDEINKLP